MSFCWQSKVLTLFPEIFPGPLGMSLAGQAIKKKLWSLETLNLRDYGIDGHARVDDTPFGGGPGMVLRPDVIDAALQVARQNAANLPLLVTSPRGVPLNQVRVRELANGPGLIILCGRYEGIDQRVIEEHRIEEVSVGDFVLSGGEPFAIALLDACVRLLPGVMGKPQSADEESFVDGLLEYPHYTRPKEWKDLQVPEVLLSGHHKNIQQWRETQAKAVTKERRPDLWNVYQEQR